MARSLVCLSGRLAWSPSCRNRTGSGRAGCLIGPGGVLVEQPEGWRDDPAAQHCGH